MATTEHFYTGNNSTTSFAFTFPYLANSDVKVELDNVLKTENSSGQTNNDYTINNTNIVFNTAPGSGVSVHIFRSTNVDTAQATYAAGSSIRAVDLNNNQTQALYSAQESAGQLVRQSDLKDSIVNSAKIVDGSIVNADVNASAAIAGTKVSPNFGSQNIVTTGTGATGNLGVTGDITVSGSVDGRDVAADGTKLDTIETNAKDDQTASEIKTLYESNSNTNEFSDAEQTKLAGIETAATADQTAAEIRTLVESATDSNVFTDADHTKLNGIETAATADQTVGEIKSLIAGSPLDASHLAANSVTTSEIADAELTTLAGMQSGTASVLADTTALTSTTTELNQLDGKTLGETTLTTNSDTAIPTSKAVADFVSSTVAPLGGLEVISNEVSFPNTQPASGVVISISDAGGTVFNGSGVSTTGRTVGGSTVTINGAPSSLNNETLVAGVGLMVSSTGSSQTYNYHKILGKEDDIKQLSDDINDFNARYRVGSSNPTSALDAGDLFFNTSTQKLLVYNATNSAWEEAQSIGNFYISTFSESFDNSRTQFTVSNAPTNAQQLIISINGVIQKPNSGTGQPSEGFTLSGSTVTFSAAIPSGSDYFVIVLGSTVNIGTPSNNTVSSSILQNGSVIESKLANEAVTLAKLEHGTSSNDGKFLRANNGADPSFETVNTTTNLGINFYSDSATVTSSSGTNVSITAATTSQAGLMSTTMKSKLDGIATGATNSPTTIITNNADNRVITGSGTANTLNGESSVLIDSSSRIQRGSDPSNLGTAALNIVDGNGHGINISRNQGAACTDDQRMGAIAFHSGLGGQSTVTGGASIEAFAEENQSGSTNATRLVFNTKPSGTGPGSAPTERMRIHSNGAVSIANTRNYYGALNVEAGVITSGSSAIDVKASGTNKEILSFGDHNTISGELRLTNSSHVDFGTSSNHPLIFYTGSSRTERMRITSDGYVYAIGQAGSYISNTGLYHQFINTGNGRWTMQIKQEHHNGMNTQMLVNSVTNIEAFQIYSTSNNTTRFRVLNNGNVGSASNSYGGISDIKLKENIVDAKSQWDDIKAVKVRNFNFKDTPDTKMLGVVAQEIETVSPSLVSEIVDRDPNDSTKEIGTTKEVKYSILYMKAIKCLQEAMAKIEVLETKVAALEAA